MAILGGGLRLGPSWLASLRSGPRWWRSGLASSGPSGRPRWRRGRPAASTVPRSGTVCLGVVGALGVHVGAEARDQRVGGVVVEDDHRVDRAQRADQLRALRRGHDRPARALEAADRGVGVEPDTSTSPSAARRPEVADVAHVEEVEDAVGEHEPLARRAARRPRPAAASSSPRTGAIGLSAARAWRAPPGVTVAVPRFMTTTPPATLASHAASAGAAPAASATVNALITVSPAPVTSAIWSLPWIGMNVTGAVALEERHAPAAARDEEQARVEALEHRAPRLLDGRARRRAPRR